MARPLVAIVLFLVLGGGVVRPGGHARAAEHYPQALGVLTTERGREAIDFTVKDLDGKVHRLKDYRGKVVLLGFGTTW